MGGLYRVCCICPFCFCGLFDIGRSFAVPPERDASLSLSPRRDGVRIPPTKSLRIEPLNRQVACSYLPLLPTQEGGEGRGEEEFRSLWRPSLRLSPHSFLVGRESSHCAIGFMGTGERVDSKKSSGIPFPHLAKRRRAAHSMTLPRYSKFLAVPRGFGGVRHMERKLRTVQRRISCCGASKTGRL